MESATHVFIAGIGNSGPEHWQALWHGRVAGSVWVEHASWDAPLRDVWVKELDDTLRAIEGPKVLIAHSLGCTLVAEWASEYEDHAVTGAFLVAMPDVHGSNFPTAAVGFDAPPQTPLPFPALVVASEDDPYGSLESASAGAERLGAQLVGVGAKGHINAASGLADWPEGWSLFSEKFTG
ncbi:RBBP9/YdeN family alpha/beta hydrolase [Streptomyces sp. DSM 116496]|uniref:RBBP9/YdeN family alpha/beta hydrolase n=1 Tax=Streptomyces stoeckheimensis TaxID=3344656 RepID=UPI0038B31ADC